MKPQIIIKAYDGTTLTEVQRLNLPAGSVGEDGTVDLGLGVKVYRALLKQASTDAPVATVLENTLGGEVVWTYVASGRYDGTLAGVFTSGKTAINSGSCVNSAGDTLLGWFAGIRTSVNAVRLISTVTNDAASPADDALTATLVEILVYPS